MGLTQNLSIALFLVLMIGCKNPSKPANGSTSKGSTGEQSSQDEIPSGGENTAEEGAEGGPAKPEEPKVPEEIVTRASEIHDTLIQLLDKKYSKDKGIVWSSARMELSGDWIVESPEGLWGLDADQLPKNLDCDPKKEGCNADFKRMACESDSDCSEPGTHCAPLEATVSWLDQAPEKLCLGPSDKLIDRFYRVMVSANKELDIVSLSMPDGRFRIAMNHALSVLSQKPNPPTVRMLFSGFNAALPNILNPPAKVLGDIMKDVEKLTPSAKALPVNLAWFADGKLSWNHAKIIVADGSLALSGGHNMWDNDYLRPNPISDLSLEFSGEAAAKARDYINALWREIKDNFAAAGENVERIAEHQEQPLHKSGASAIHVGRMGSYGANPGDDAIIGMLDAAKTSVMIDQQDYFNVIVTKTDLTRSFAFDAIINAALRGLPVTLIQSNKYPLGNYGMVDPAKAYKNFIDELTKRLQKEQDLSRGDARTKACELLVMAPFRINSKLNEWPNGGGVYGSHTKLVMVDEAAVYVGSQNLYPANLQEYGSIITDAEATAHFKKEYWDKVWTESSSAKLACPK